MHGCRQATAWRLQVPSSSVVFSEASLSWFDLLVRAPGVGAGIASAENFGIFLSAQLIYLTVLFLASNTGVV